MPRVYTLEGVVDYSNLPVPVLGDRALFPRLRAEAYLAHAAISPPSLRVEAAMYECLLGYSIHGAMDFPTAVDQRARLREKLATLLGATRQEVALVPNTTAGVTDIALSIPWKPGDRVVLFRGEFPANVTPWQRAAELFKLDLLFHDADLFRLDPTHAFERLDHDLRWGARLVALSSVEFQTGLRMPLAEITKRCHAQGAEVFVDAIQGLGSVPMDVAREGVDYLSAGSHKWLMGVEGCGVLYVKAELAKTLRPYTAGWLGHENPTGFLFEGEGRLRYDRPLRARADVFENGTFNASGCFALEASLDGILGLGVENIHRHVNAYLDVLEEGLVRRGFVSLRSRSPEARSCILGVRPPAGSDVNAPALQQSLARYGVITSVPDGVLRFAPHWPNHPREVDAVLAAVDEILG